MIISIKTEKAFKNETQTPFLIKNSLSKLGTGRNFFILIKGINEITYS